MRGGEDLTLKLVGKKFGKIEDISLDQRTVDIKKAHGQCGIAS